MSSSLRDPERNPAHQQNEQVSIILTSEAAKDLQRLQTRTTLSQADIINRAITLYKFIDDYLSSGYQLILQDDVTGEISRVQIR